MRTTGLAAAGLLVAVILMTSCTSTPPQAGASAPVAPRHPHVRDVHGDRFVDDYFWLRQKTNPAVVAYLEAENAHTAAVMKPTRRLQQRLYREMVGRIQETDVDVPVRLGGWLYYDRTREGSQYPIHCRKPVSGDGGEQVLLDVNELARGESFMSVGLRKVSDDGRLLAFISDNTGFRQYRLRIRDLAGNRMLPDTAERVTSVAWLADNRTLLYVTEDPVTKRRNQVHRLVLGGIPELVFEEKDERFSVYVERTRSGDYLLLTCQSRTATEVRFLDARAAGATWRLVARREDNHEYFLDHHDDRFVLRSNRGGRNFALFDAPVTDPSPARWRELVPHRADVMIEDVLCFAGYRVVQERAGGLVRFRVTPHEGGAGHDIGFPEPAYVAGAGGNPEYRTAEFRYHYHSPVTPPSVFDHELATGRDVLRKREPVLGGYDPSRYVVERREAVARDGTRVPVALLSRQGTARDGSAPLLLEGYGAYGIPSDAEFRSAVFSLVDRGFVVATAQIRGGGDLGKPWHDAGRMASKMNTFTDFIDAAEFLVREGYTRPDRLVITGGSAGGLLMGAVCNLRPDLFRAVVNYVPFVDVINTMLDESLPLTVEEFEEWGNPKVPSEYRWLRAYCPYTNLEAKAYPAMLVKTSFNDSQVMYWEPAKYVARLRRLKTDDRALLFDVNMAGGHGGSSGRYQHLRDRALDYAFILEQVGITR